MLCKRESEILPCTPQDAKLLCFPKEIDTHRKIHLDSTPLCPEMHTALDTLQKEYKDILSFRQDDIGHSKFFTMDIDTGDHLHLHRNLKPHP